MEKLMISVLFSFCIFSAFSQSGFVASGGTSSNTTSLWGYSYV